MEVGCPICKTILQIEGSHPRFLCPHCNAELANPNLASSNNSNTEFGNLDSATTDSAKTESVVLESDVLQSVEHESSGDEEIVDLVAVQPAQSIESQSRKAPAQKRSQPSATQPSKQITAGDSSQNGFLTPNVLVASISVLVVSLVVLVCLFAFLGSGNENSSDDGNAVAQNSTSPSKEEEKTSPKNEQRRGVNNNQRPDRNSGNSNEFGSGRPTGFNRNTKQPSPNKQPPNKKSPNKQSENQTQKTDSGNKFANHGDLGQQPRKVNSSNRGPQNGKALNPFRDSWSELAGFVSDPLSHSEQLSAIGFFDDVGYEYEIQTDDGKLKRTFDGEFFMRVKPNPSKHDYKTKTYEQHSTFRTVNLPSLEYGTGIGLPGGIVVVPRRLIHKAQSVSVAMDGKNYSVSPSLELGNERFVVLKIETGSKTFPRFRAFTRNELGPLDSLFFVRPDGQLTYGGDFSSGGFVSGQSGIGDQRRRISEMDEKNVGAVLFSPWGCATGVVIHQIHWYETEKKSAKGYVLPSSSLIELFPEPTRQQLFDSAPLDYSEDPKRARDLVKSNLVQVKVQREAESTDYVTVQCQLRQDQAPYTTYSTRHRPSMREEETNEFRLDKNLIAEPSTTIQLAAFLGRPLHSVFYPNQPWSKKKWTVEREFFPLSSAGAVDMIDNKTQELIDRRLSRFRNVVQGEGKRVLDFSVLSEADGEVKLRCKVAVFRKGDQILKGNQTLTIEKKTGLLLTSSFVGEFVERSKTAKLNFSMNRLSKEQLEKQSPDWILNPNSTKEEEPKKRDFTDAELSKYAKWLGDDNEFYRMNAMEKLAQAIPEVNDEVSKALCTNITERFATLLHGDLDRYRKLGDDWIQPKHLAHLVNGWTYKEKDFKGANRESYRLILRFLLRKGPLELTDDEQKKKLGRILFPSSFAFDTTKDAIRVLRYWYPEDADVILQGPFEEQQNVSAISELKPVILDLCSEKLVPSLEVYNKKNRLAFRKKEVQLLIDALRKKKSANPNQTTQ